ncbi:MAG: hypothetical protein K0R26_889 [Bacteroidota bacterium]|nr:hypothetical protein [Bacteroidota bacterium]
MIFENAKGTSGLDYVCAWYVRAPHFMQNSKIKLHLFLQIPFHKVRKLGYYGMYYSIGLIKKFILRIGYSLDS